MAERSYYHTSRFRGSSGDELSHIRGQGRKPRGATTRRKSGEAAERSNPGPRSSGCTGAGGQRGATLRSRSGGAAMRR